MRETAVLRISWSTSRGRDTYGYNICRLDDELTGKRYRCMGGGYDMVGTVFGEWLAETYQARLQEISGEAYYSNGYDRTSRASTGCAYATTDRSRWTARAGWSRCSASQSESGWRSGARMTVVETRQAGS